MMSDKYLQVLFENTEKKISENTDGITANSENRAKSTMDALKSYILANNLKPGDPLPTEAALCENLGVSRSSVREALRKLETLDIVTVQQGRGSFVGEMSLTPLVETLILRTALQQQNSRNQSLSEVVAIRRALDLGTANIIVEQLKGTHNPEIWELVRIMTEKSAVGESYLAEDIAFHSALLKNLKNDLLQQLISSMWLINQTIIPKLNAGKDRELEITARAHRKMLIAAEAGDLASYIEAIEEHYAPLERLIIANQDESLA